MEQVANLILLIVPIMIGYFIGKYNEKKHYESIREREKYYRNIPVTTLKTLKTDKKIASVEFVSGSVVISIDYFKRFIASLRFLFGGRVTTYESLIDRGRREAILRMIEKTYKPDIVYNLKIETSSISKGAKKTVGSVEVFAYATAVRYE